MTKSYSTTDIAFRLALRASVSQILANPRSYAKGQTTTEIVETIKELYDVDISSSLVSRVTDNILEYITAWQNRPLSSIYPTVYLDCIVVKVRQDKQIINTVYPKAQVQLCIVHMVRYSMKFVPWTNKKAVAADLKAIYGADTLEIAEANLEQFDETWGEKYPHVVKSWRNHWEGLTVFFNYPKDIRKVIYSTNTVESLNSVIRTTVNKRKMFPSDQAAFKVVYLATQQASNKWSMPISNWTSALNRFMIMFDDRISKHLI